MPSLRRSLVGRDPFLAVAAPLAGLLVGGLLWLVDPAPLGRTVGPSAAGWWLLGALVAVSAALAAWNDGLTVCWLAVAGPLAAGRLRAALAAGAVDATGPRYAVVLGALAAAAGAAAVVGTVGFLLGVGLRQLVGGARARWAWRTAG